MLAFDIETTGLDPASSVVTVVCTEDFRTGERRAYEFGRVRACEPQNEALLRDELIRALDEAAMLCALNGVRFDIPFLHSPEAFGKDDGRLAPQDYRHPRSRPPWPLRPGAHLRPQLLCQHNQVPVKAGSGLQAIKFVQEHKWDELQRYYADDVRILCDLYRRRFLNNPRFHSVIDLRKIAPESTFLECLEKTSKNLFLLYQAETKLCAQEAEILDPKQMLAVYHEFCVCFHQIVDSYLLFLQEQVKDYHLVWPGPHQDRPSLDRSSPRGGRAWSFGGTPVTRV
jgi:hypothetical protein